MIDLQIVTEFMLENFEQTKISNSGTHFLARCLLCGDSAKSQFKKRFNLDYNDGNPGWHCWNCGRSGSFIEIYSIVKGLDYDEVVKLLYKTFDKDRIRNRLSSKKKNKEKRTVVFYNWIKDSCYSIYDEDNRYVNALKLFYIKRKIPEVYKLYICYTGKYVNRIIIPIYNKKLDIIYFQARRIPGTGLIPKYDNPATPKDLCILNKHLFDRSKDIVVHEGLIDAFMVGDQGTSCLGKEISEELLKELLSLTDKNVIIALDNDSEAYKALAKFLNKNKYARKVKYFLYPQHFKDHDDINSIVRGEAIGNIYELITQNSVSFSTAYTKLSILKLLEGKADENNKRRKRLH